MSFKLVSAAALAITLAGCVAAPPPPGGWPPPPPGPGGPGPGPGPGWPGPGGPGPGWPGGPGPGPGPGGPGPGWPGGPGPGPGGPGSGGRECREGPARFALGERYSTRLADEAASRSRAEVVRVIRPGQAVTQDYNPRRLNIELDRRDRVVSVSCG